MGRAEYDTRYVSREPANTRRVRNVGEDARFSGCADLNVYSNERAWGSASSTQTARPWGDWCRLPGPPFDDSESRVWVAPGTRLPPASLLRSGGLSS
jgi:hypothetical protein